MSIEEPHLALEAIKGTVGPDDPVNPFGQTIAWFYAKLRASIIRLARDGKSSSATPATARGLARLGGPAGPRTST